eukprot:2226303-Rhodomonas_salina.1
MRCERQREAREKGAGRGAGTLSARRLRRWEACSSASSDAPSRTCHALMLPGLTSRDQEQHAGVEESREVEERGRRKGGEEEERKRRGEEERRRRGRGEEEEEEGATWKRRWWTG